MQRAVGLKRLPLLVFTAVAVCTLMPLALTQLGVSYGSASQGGAGAHFAGYVFQNFVIRMDVPAAGLLLFLVFLWILHYRVSPSRFVNVMAASLLFAGLAQTVQIVPCTFGSQGPTDYAIQVVRSATLGYLGTGLLLCHGALFVTFGPRNSSRRILLPALAINTILLSSVWAAMAGVFGSLSGLHHQIHIFTLGLFLATGILLKPEMRPRILRFLKLGVTGMLIPLTAGLIWVNRDVHSIFNQGFHIAVLLWWMALLLPVLGLGIDFINIYYGKGMAGEKRFLRKVIDAIPHFIFARDAEGRFTLVNKAVAQFYGLSTGQIEGRHLYDVHHDSEQRDLWLQEDADVLRGGKPVALEETMTRDAGGNPIWIDAIKTPLLGRGSDQNQVLGISIDITRQKTAEIALADRLKFEQTATSVVQQFIKCNIENFDRNVVGILETVATFARGTRCYIYRFDETSGEADQLYYWQDGASCRCSQPPPSLAPADTGWLQPWFNLNKPYAIACMTDLPQQAAGFRDVWGNSKDNALIILPITYQGSLFGFLGLDSCACDRWSHEEIVLLRNIADLFITVWTKLETEKNLTKAMKEAQASNRAKSEFLANMSHEIRTPMNCVIGISELLMDMDPTPSQKQYLEMISQSGASLLTLINDVLDLSKIEAGQLEIDPVESNLRNLVEEVAGLIAFNAQAKGLEMVCRYAPGAPDLAICDANRLRQVLTNLLNNAVKFTQEGHIYLNVEPVGRQGELLELQFQVVDTGIGIPQEQLGKIFEKFTQADPSTTRRFGGTGLGLSISQQLVQLMGGQIKADSLDGKGSTFTFTLPVEVVEESLQAPEQVAEPQSEILVVSKHELGCEVLAEQVRHLGYVCTTALGCQQGLKLLDNRTTTGGKDFSFILIDQDVLPPGTPMIKDFLDNLPEKTRPRLVLLTSLSSLLREADLTNRGFSGTLTKPVRPGRLAQVLGGAAGIDERTIAITAEPEAPTTLATEIADDKTDGPLILLAEDNPFNQKVATGMLKLLGCRVEVANNGAEALAMVQEKTFDLLFMDCQMPEMDGYEATRQIRKLPAPQGETKIIAMTANALSGDRNACFTAGMNDFLSKPITKAMLTDMLAKWDLIKAPVSS